jgi:hypothetical protein
MAYLGRDAEIHVIHRVVEHVASLEYPSPQFKETAKSEMTPDFPPSGLGWPRWASSMAVASAAASEPPNSLLYSLPTVGRPVISPELARSVVALQFCDGHDDLEGCLSIFAVSYPSQDSVTAANERNGLYDQQANGTTAPTWSDLLDGKKSRSLKLPTDWFQLR